MEGRPRGRETWVVLMVANHSVAQALGRQARSQDGERDLSSIEDIHFRPAFFHLNANCSNEGTITATNGQ